MKLIRCGWCRSTAQSKGSVWGSSAAAERPETDLPTGGRRRRTRRRERRRPEQGALSGAVHCLETAHQRLFLSGKAANAAAAADRCRLVLPGTSVACINPAQKGYSGEAMRSRKCSKSTQSRSWMATISAEKMHREEIEEALEQYSYIGQLEKGEEGSYRHWQLLIDGNTSPIRFSTLKNKLPTAHLEPRRGPIQQAIEYVTKEETRVLEEPRLEHGTIRHGDERGRRKDVDIVREAVLEKGLSVDEIFLQVPEAARMTSFVERLVAARERAQNSEPREIEVLWLYGPPGTGKTSLAVDIGGDDFYRVTDYSHPFDSYAGEKTLILDEFDGSMPLSLVLNILDVWPMSLPARYANKAAAYTQAVMVSNESPWGYYLWEPASRRQALARRIDTIIHIDSYGAHDETRLRDKFFA